MSRLKLKDVTDLLFLLGAFGHIVRALSHAEIAFSNEVHHQGLGSTRPEAECFLASGDAPSWEMRNFQMDMGSGFYPMTCKKHHGS